MKGETATNWPKWGLFASLPICPSVYAQGYKK